MKNCFCLQHIEIVSCNIRMYVDIIYDEVLKKYWFEMFLNFSKKQGLVVTENRYCNK